MYLRPVVPLEDTPAPVFNNRCRKTGPGMQLLTQIIYLQVFKINLNLTEFGPVVAPEDTPVPVFNNRCRKTSSGMQLLTHIIIYTCDRLFLRRTLRPWYSTTGAWFWTGCCSGGHSGPGIQQLVPKNRSRYLDRWLLWSWYPPTGAGTHLTSITGWSNSRHLVHGSLIPVIG